MKTWSAEELEILLQNYNLVSNDELAKLLPQKSNQAIYKKAYKLGLRKTGEIEFLNRSNARKREKSSRWCLLELSAKSSPNSDTTNVYRGDKSI